MAGWPGNPVARMTVESFGGGASASVHFLDNVSNSQTIADVDIEWSIDIEFDDHPYVDNGRGWFRANLQRLSPDGGYIQVDAANRSLGNNDDDGHWSDTLRLEATMDEALELYVIELECGTSATHPGVSVDPVRRSFLAIQGSEAVGSFTVDFHPVSIVYCPPNQDMSASLTQSVQYGTRLTIGTSDQFQSETRSGFDVSALGVRLGGVSVTDSRSVANRSEAGIEVSYFRNTVLTADNQRAIGRAYWGPLGDLFVIAVNPRFAVSERADGTLFYAPEGMDQIIVVPAYKLLRPDADPIVRSIPSSVRRELLELDPFIENLDQFFPDSGVPLANAANPYADPTRRNRAERLGRWWLNNATELNYSIGESKELKSGEASEIQFTSTITQDANIGINLYNKIGFGAQSGNSFSTTLALQSSRETVSGASETASCYLIRNQNEKDLDGIEIYYDKTFSTLMFRKVRARRRRLTGVVVDTHGELVSQAEITLEGRDRTQSSSTDTSGFYEFEVEPGTYTLALGNQSWPVTIAGTGDEADDGGPEFGGGVNRMDLRNVRRSVDLERSPVWSIRKALNLDSITAWRLSRFARNIFDARDLALVIDRAQSQLESELDDLDLDWARTPLEALPDITSDQIRRLERAGVDSAQRLWSSQRDPDQLETLAADSGLPESTLRTIASRVESIRAVNLPRESLGLGAKDGSVRYEPQPAYLSSNRVKEFQATKTYRTMFAGDRDHQQQRP